jgi:hypothetical protein
MFELSQIRNEQVQTKNDLQKVRKNLIECSCFDQPDKLNSLLDIVQNVAMKLGQITTELRKLQRSLC